MFGEQKIFLNAIKGLCINSVFLSQLLKNLSIQSASSTEVHGQTFVVNSFIFLTTTIPKSIVLASVAKRDVKILVTDVENSFWNLILLFLKVKNPNIKLEHMYVLVCIQTPLYRTEKSLCSRGGKGD